MTERIREITTTALVSALRIAEGDLESGGWGDETTRLYAVIKEDSEPWLNLVARFEAYPADVINEMIEMGHGFAEDAATVGVVVLSEAWRHLTAEELRIAVGEQATDLLGAPQADEDWEVYARMMRERTRPRDLPDHLRHEVRVAVCVLRDDRLIQIFRDRGADEVNVSEPMAVSELPANTFVPQALASLLNAPGKQAES